MSLIFYTKTCKVATVIGKENGGEGYIFCSEEKNVSFMHIPHRRCQNISAKIVFKENYIKNLQNIGSSCEKG